MSTRLWMAFFLAVMVLAAQPDKTAWNILRQGLAEKNPEKRRQAVTAIGSIGLAPEAVGYLEGALKDQDALVRQTAAAVLGQLKARRSIAALKVSLDDASPEVAFAAAKAMWEMGDRSGRALLERTFTGKQRATATVLLGPFDIGIIGAEQAFKDSGAGARALSAILLGEDCDAQSLRLLESASAGDKNWAVRAAASNAIGQCGNRDAIARLEHNLADNREAVKYMSAASIIRLSAKTRASVLPDTVRGID